MIDKLHNIADTILGIDNIKVIDPLYKLIIINENDRRIELRNSEGNIVSPMKINRTNNVEYQLAAGIYYLRSYIKGEPEVKNYYEEIYVASEMVSRIRTIRIA